MKLIELAYFTEDVQGLTDFYRRLLGADPVTQSENMAIFMNTGVKIFIHKTYEPSAGDLPPENHTAFAVEDVDATCAALVGRGLALEVPPRDYYWGRSAYLRDPDGFLIELTKE